MVSRYRLIGALAGIMVLAGCVLPGPWARRAAAPAASGDVSPGHWDIVRRIEYYTLPAENLKGDISPAYRTYLVSVAGFHTDAYGIAVGPDDDARFTTDGGQTWTKAPGELHCRHGLDVVNEKTAWHCGNGGTRVTTDGGQTWQTVTKSKCPLMSFLDAQTGWAASPYSLQVTTDGGTSWNDITLPLGAQNIAGVLLRTAEEGYVLSTGGDLWITADGGRSWETRSLGLKPGEQLMAGSATGPYAVLRFWDAQRGLVVFALSDQSVWFATTQDGGQRWQRAEIPELRGQSYYYHLFLSHDGTLLTVTDDFNNGQNVSLVLRYQEP